MLVLAFDTSTADVTAAVVDVAAAPRVLAEQDVVAPNRHGEVLAPLIAEVLQAAGVDMRDLTAVGVGVGPGPFTGLRVGLATAAALSDALEIPAYGVCSLDAIARGRGAVLVVTDARRREVYWAAYDDGGHRVAGPAVARPGDVPVVGRAVVGPATTLYPEQLPGAPAYPRAADVAALVADRARDRAPGDPLTPLYLRRPDAVPPGPPKLVTRG